MNEKEMPPGRSAHIPGLGPLEQRVMQLMWRAGEVSVRDVYLELGETLAYTTLMTTLDRLHKKGLLERRKEGRAFFYAPRVTPNDLERSLMRRLLDGLLGRGARGVEPVLACIVDAVSEHDRELLDELDHLIREKRRELQGRKR